MLQDLRFAVRTLFNNVAFTSAAVVCLALGIGVNATIFSCVRAILLRPYPYRNPDALVAIGESNPKRGWHMNSVSYPNFRSWQAENRTLDNIGMYSGASYNLASGDGADYSRAPSCHGPCSARWASHRRWDGTSRRKRIVSGQRV